MYYVYSYIICDIYNISCIIMHFTYIILYITYIIHIYYIYGAWGSVVVKALRY